METFSIKIYKQNVYEILEFPIKPTDAKKAVLVEFEPGNAWIFTSIFSQLRAPSQYSRSGKYCLDVDVDFLPRLFRYLSINMRDELVEVKKAGKGPTEKSHKFKVEVLQEIYDECYSPDDDRRYKRVTKTLTLGWYGITEIKGKFFARRKMLEERLDKLHVLPIGRLSYNELELLVQAAAERVAAAYENEKAERKARTLSPAFLEKFSRYLPVTTS